MPHEEPADAVDVLVAQLLEAQRAGRRADCDALLRQHPQHAAELAAVLADYQVVESRFAPLRRLSSQPAGAAELATLAVSGDTTAELPRVGSTFGDYELLSEVARGGMGVVYRARQKSLNRIVALKMVLGGKRVSATDRDRFLVEARAVARLNHPHIVPIYEVGEQQGQPYFTMEFLSGGSLRDQSESLSGQPRTIARKMIVIARAVEHAHRRGILHRDLKPTNVLLDERGEPHVTDFGLAKQLDQQSDLTQAGAIVGTPSYMAPEQANAQSDLTTAADVYGLGALMYELLCGRPPFKGSTPLETMLAVMSTEPTRPRKLVPSLDEELETICLKCLEKDPLARYASAEALADDLERWLEGQPIAARPATTTQRLVKWSKRQPLLAGSLATLLATALGLLILAGFLWQNAEARAQAVKSLDEARSQLAHVDAQRNQAEAAKTTAEQLAERQRQLADQQRQLADQQRQQAAEQRKLADTIQAEVKRLEQAARQAENQLRATELAAHRTRYAADLQLAHAAWQGGNFVAVSELLGRYADPAGQADLRGFEWFHLQRQLHGARQSWRNPTNPQGLHGMTVGLAVSPDGKTLATAEINSGNLLRVWNLADGKLQRTIDLKPANIQGLAFGNLVGVFFADEGRSLVAVTRKNFDVRQIEKMLGPALSGKAQFSLGMLNDALEFQTCSLDQPEAPVRTEPFDVGRLATGLFPILSGGLFATHNGQMVMIMALARSADGKRLALAGASSDVGHRERAQAAIDRRAAGLPPDDASRPGTIDSGWLMTWDLEKQQPLAVQKTPQMVSAVAWSPAGNQVALGTSDGAVGVAPADLSQPPQRLLAHDGTLYALEFSGDGTRLASAAMDSQVIEWDLKTGTELRRYRGHLAAIARLAYTPDDRLLVSTGLDGTIKVWDRRLSGAQQVLQWHQRPVSSLRFSADQSQLISLDMREQAASWRVADGTVTPLSQPQSALGLGTQLSPSGKLVVGKEKLNDSVVVRRLDNQQVVQLSWPGHAPFNPIVSADDQFVAASSVEPAGLIVWNLAEKKQLATLPLPGLLLGLAFSPDGNRLAAAQGNGVLLWDWRTGRSQRVLEQEGAEATGVAFSPDGRLLAAALGRRNQLGQVRVRLWDLAANQLVTEMAGLGQMIRLLAFSPDGRRLAGCGTSGQRGSLQLWDTASGREVFSLNPSNAVFSALAWSGDNRYLALGVSRFDLTAALTDRTLPADIYLLDARPIP